MSKFFKNFIFFFKKSPKKISSIIKRRYDDEYEGWLGV